MAEYDPQKVGYLLEVGEEYHNTLDIEGFSRMMQSPSYCYKFYWLEAIVNLISQDIAETTFDEIIDEMIAKVIAKHAGKVNSQSQTPKIQRRDLLDEQESIANLRKYHLAIQNVKIPEDMRKFLSRPKDN